MSNDDKTYNYLVARTDLWHQINDTMLGSDELGMDKIHRNTEVETLHQTLTQQYLDEVWRLNALFLAEANVYWPK